jgi:hypothetical protein
VDIYAKIAGRVDLTQQQKLSARCLIMKIGAAQRDPKYGEIYWQLAIFDSAVFLH